MNVSKPQAESTSSKSPYKLYTGIEAFSVVAVNPTMKELEAMGMTNIVEEPKYINNDDDYTVATIRIMLDNNDVLNPIKTSVNYYITNNRWNSKTGKVQVINSFGQTTWVTVDDKDVITIPENIASWYVTEGVKIAKRGEEDLLSFIKALYNLPTVSKETNKDSYADSYAFFEENDYKKLFSGDFSEIRNTLLSCPENKVSLLLGVRKSDDSGRLSQVVYSSSPMRSYQKSNTTSLDWLVKRVRSTQENGGYATTVFDFNDLSLKEFTDNITITPNEVDDLPFSL